MNVLKQSVAFTVGTAALALSFCGMHATVNAQLRSEMLSIEQRGDFVLEPGKQEILLAPGEEVTKTLSITNRSRDGITFSLNVEDIIGSESAEDPVILLGDKKGPYTLKDLVSFPVDSVTLDLGERVTIPFTISIPEDAEPGGRYGAVIASNAPSKEGELQEGSGTTIVSRLGSILLVRIKGNVQEQGQLEEIRTLGGKRIFFSGRPQGFEVLYRNSGNVHLVPYGTVTISNLFGTQVAQLPVDAYFALPQSLRYREVPWESQSFMFGRYKATVDLNRGYGDLKDADSVVIWVLPLPWIGGAIAVLGVLGLLIHFVTSRFQISKRS